MKLNRFQYVFMVTFLGSYLTLAQKTNASSESDGETEDGADLRDELDDERSRESKKRRRSRLRLSMNLMKSHGELPLVSPTSPS